MGTRAFVIGVGGLISALVLAGCESAPRTSAPVSAGMATGTASQQADATALGTGRTLYAARCAACHTLPKAAAHSAEQWPALVAGMAKRSGLNPEQSQQVLAYILATRSSGQR